MEKIWELVRNGKFSANLMADKEFVKGAKEIFKSQNIEIDDKKLAQILDEIENQIKNSGTLRNEVLEKVSGGLTNENKKNIIMEISRITGGALGALTGVGISYVAGEGMSKILPKNIENYVSRNTVKGAVASGGALSVATFSVEGATLAMMLGKWICKKAGLEEEIKS